MVHEPVRTSDTRNGAACWKQFQQHFESRPTATGIEELQSRPSDVVVTTFPKSGTTLTQHMAYQIIALSGGGPSFDRSGRDFPDLSVVSPWVDYIPQIGIPACETSPRLFKTHKPVSAFSAHNCRHIVVLRNPVTYPSSFLDFLFDAVVPESSSISDDARESAFHQCAKDGIETPVDETDDAKPLGKWHSFMKNSVLPLRENVLLIFYEDIVSDFPQAVRTVAKFMGCSLSEEAVLEVAKRCDRKAMSSDVRFACRIEKKCFGITREINKSKVLRKDGFKRFKIRKDVIETCEQMNEDLFGVRTYEEVHELLRKKQWEMFRR